MSLFQMINNSGQLHFYLKEDKEMNKSGHLRLVICFS